MTEDMVISALWDNRLHTLEESKIESALMEKN